MVLASKHQTTSPRCVRRDGPAYRDVIRQTWPEDGELQEEVMESPAAMRKAADFTLRNGLAILAWLENAEEEKGFALI